MLTPKGLSFPFLSFPFLSLPFPSLPFPSFPFLSFPFLSFPFLSFPFLRSSCIDVCLHSAFLVNQPIQHPGPCLLFSTTLPCLDALAQTAACELLSKVHPSYLKALLLCQATCQLAQIAALLSLKTAACLPYRLLLAIPTDCCLHS